MANWRMASVSLGILYDVVYYYVSISPVVVLVLSMMIEPVSCKNLSGRIKISASLDFTVRLYYPLCVSHRIDTWQIVYLSNKDPS